MSTTQSGQTEDQIALVDRLSPEDAHALTAIFGPAELLAGPTTVQPARPTPPTWTRGTTPPAPSPSRAWPRPRSGQASRRSPSA